jgi:two-component system response regulator
MSILIVENNSNDEKLARMAFEQKHPLVKIIIMRNGNEAIEYLFGVQEIALPKLVLLDLKMPRVNGLEVLRRIRHDNRTRWIPVIILSSSSEPEDMQQAYALGANSYIRKPMDFEHFLFVVDYLTTYWLDINHSPRHAISPTELQE